MIQNRLNHSEPSADLSQSASGATAPAPTVSTLVGVVPERLLDEGEVVVLAIKPSLWFILFHSVKRIAVVIMAVAILPYLPGDLLGGTTVRTLCQIGTILVAGQLVVSFLQWLSRLYVLTNRRVMRIRGVFNIDVFEAPLTRIQNTFITLAIQERLLALGTIQFATAGTGSVEASWVNINRPLEVHEIVRKAVHQAQGGKTDSGV